MKETQKPRDSAKSTASYADPGSLSIPPLAGLAPVGLIEFGAGVGAGVGAETGTSGIFSYAALMAGTHCSGAFGADCTIAWIIGSSSFDFCLNRLPHRSHG